MNLIKKVWVTLQGVARHPLNRRPGWRAAWDFSVVQVAVRLVPGDVCVAFPNECRLLISPHMKGAAHFIFPGLCEFEEMSFVMHFLRPDDRFVDVGANVGAYTLLAGGVAKATTIAFEPVPSTFGYLAANVRLNGLGASTTLVQAAVGAAEGEIRLTDNLGTENFVCVGAESSRTQTVPLTTLDKALAGTRPALMKIDVEGFEKDALAGGRESVAAGLLPAMIVERAGNGARYGYDEGALHGQIRSWGYVPYAYEPFGRKLRRLPDEAPGNIIYLRDVEAAQKRVQAAPAYRFAGLEI